jgi:hypothetical protein
VAAETQPLPTKPAPFARQLLTEDLLTNRTPGAHQWALEPELCTKTRLGAPMAWAAARLPGG